MVDSSTSSNLPQWQRHYHITPATTRHASHYFTPLSSHSHQTPLHNYTPRRTCNPSPTSSFTTDDNRLWQGKLTWQFDASGWRDTWNLSTALSPWIPSESRVFWQSAFEYFLSSMSSGTFQIYTNPHRVCSGYGTVPGGRLELQRFVDRESNESAFLGRNYAVSSENNKAKKGGHSKLEVIKEASVGTDSSLAYMGKLQMIEYHKPRDLERKRTSSGPQKTNHYVSMDDEGYDYDGHGHRHDLSNAMDHHLHHHRHHHHSGLGHCHGNRHDDIETVNPKDEELGKDEEDEEKPAKPYGFLCS